MPLSNEKGRTGTTIGKMMSQPLFSCVMPVKGPRPYMDAALESLRSQGMGDDLEIIVQDADVEPDRGQSDAFNKGFAKAHGRWLFWLNADDVLLPNALNRVRRVIEASSARTWIAGNQIFMDKDGRITKCLWANRWHDGLYRHAIPHVNGPSAFFTRELLAKVGGFDVRMNVGMDFDLWNKFMKAGARFERIPAYLWAWRNHEGSKTSSGTRDEAELRRQADEIAAMLARQDFILTRGGAAWLRLWRLLDGSYLRSCIDTVRWRGCDLPSFAERKCGEP